jgi:hypothetical protein
VVSTQLPSQYKDGSPASHTHSPSLQLAPSAHGASQAPQCSSLLVTSTQPWPHNMLGSAQPQLASMHSPAQHSLVRAQGAPKS